jgi:hypothetical protein
VFKKNGDENTQYEGLKNEPKIDGDNDPPQKEK